MEKKNQTTEEIFTNIAKEFLFIETLETRNLDRLDFHDVSVWGVKAALEAAYNLGVIKGITTEKQKKGSLKNKAQPFTIPPTF